ncbi:hypothetical protein [Streptomyces sp. gb1(2016)]|uniref:hypothetical protein n=1 Tax=Streptomyces sp. gb1(2016) TaxID=1828321 RepID=UPI0039675CD5
MPDVPLGEFVLERGRRLGDGRDEAQVEEEFECGRRAVFLAGEASDHRPVPSADGGV